MYLPNKSSDSPRRLRYIGIRNTFQKQSKFNIETQKRIFNVLNTSKCSFISLCVAPFSAREKGCFMPYLFKEGGSSLDQLKVPSVILMLSGAERKNKRNNSRLSAGHQNLHRRSRLHTRRTAQPAFRNPPLRSISHIKWKVIHQDLEQRLLLGGF